jgi:hypothetical protein
MALALDAPFAAPTETRPSIRVGALAVPALASLGAGAIHAAAIGVHSEHRQAVFVFAIVAAIQLGLGAYALVSNRRLLGAALALANLAFVAGWVVAKASGLGFIDGLEASEPIQWADGMAAGLAGASVIGVAIAAMRGWRLPAGEALTRVLAMPVAALAITGMVAAGGHNHAAGAAGHVHTNADGTVAAPAVVPPHPFVPGEPIDLGGVPGVTPEQQAEAENILAATLYKLPQFADPAVAEARGWHSIGDGVTGDEHFVNQATFDDGKMLDPDAPESLVYEMVNGKKTLVAAMYMMAPGSTIAQAPKTGGALMQWHVHDNLCFNTAGKIAGIRTANGPCPAGLVQGGNTPMIHVWLRQNACGPFAALEGIGGGTIAPGEERLCDHVHGSGA